MAPTEPRDLPAVEPAPQRAHAAPAVRVTLQGHSPYSSPQSEPLDVRASSLPGGDWLVEVRAGPRKLRPLRLALWKLGGALGLLARTSGTALQRARELPAKRPAVAPPEPMPAALIEQAAPELSSGSQTSAQGVPPPCDLPPPVRSRAPRKLVAALASLLVAVVGAWWETVTPADAQRDAGTTAPAEPPEVPTFAARAEEAAVAAALVLAAPMPARPFEKQARPPCRIETGEVEKNGGCWFELARRPPCARGQYERDGRCYLAVATEARRPSAMQRDAGP